MQDKQSFGLEGKVRGIADVVFVLDASGSMGGVIDSVKRHIGDFASGVRSGNYVNLDLRLGLVTHGIDNAVHQHPFTTDTATFAKSLSGVDASADEWGLPAIDCALDFPWREHCRRFLVIFTDEPVSGGNDPATQIAKLDDLCRKTVDLNVKGFLFAPPCPHYDEFSQLPGWVRRTVADCELNTCDYSELLRGLGKTVSQAQGVQTERCVPRNIYGFPR